MTLLDPQNAPRSYAQPRYRHATSTRCGWCQQPFTRGQETVIVEDERVCIPCSREFWGIESGGDAVPHGFDTCSGCGCDLTAQECRRCSHCYREAQEEPW